LEPCCHVRHGSWHDLKEAQAVKTGLVASGAALGALAAIAAATAGAAPVAHTSCTAKKDLEAIIDDSGSMAGTDPTLLRVRGMKLFINTPGNERKRLGAVEFGESADTLFAPAAIGPNVATMQSALDRKILADNSTTNYNAAFAQARADNPNADARIFLTDGGHDEGEYQNGHRGGPPTYVVGFGSVTSGTDGDRLKQIASETHGRAFLQTDASNLQPVFDEISTIVNCQSPPKRFGDTFTRTGQSKRHALVLGRRTRSVSFALSWTSPADSFDIAGFKITRSGRTVAVAARRRHIRVRRRRGETFVAVKLTNVARGKLRFRVRARHLSQPGVRARLTTQASQSRRR
jgi:hypothetical protein